MARKRRVSTSKEQPPPRIEGERPTDELAFGLSARGTSGLKETGGWIYEEFLPQLAGSRGVKLYAEMEKNSASIGGVRKLVRDLTRQVEWDVVANEEASDKQAAKRIAEFVDGCRTDMEHTWAELISEALTMIEYGFAPMEITYKLRRGRGQPLEFNSKYCDGKIGWRTISLRAQDTLDHWEFERGTRRLLGMWQSDFWGSGHNATVFIPRERIANFRTESTKDNPEGRPLFRNAVVPYMRLKHIETLEMIGIDRDLTGLPVMEVPQALLRKNQQDATLREIRADVERQLASLKRHEREYLLVPQKTDSQGQPTGWDFRLEKSPGARQLDLVAIKNSYKTDIFQSCLAQFLMLGQNGNGGNRALSSDQTDLFSLSMYSILETIRETFQRECIDRLCVLNGVTDDDIPQLTFGDLEVPNLDAIGKYLAALTASGMLVPNEQLERHLHKIAGLPWQGPVTVSADQLVTEAMSGGKLSIERGAGPLPAGVKPADQLIEEALAGDLPGGEG